MPFDVNSIQSFSPDRENLWEVKFEGAPVPFDKLIPALDVSLNIWSLDTLDHAYGNTSLKTPLGTSSFPLSITFYDSEDLILTNWFEQWVNTTILVMPGCVRPLSTSHKQVEVRKLNRQHEIVKQWKLLVVPDGSADFTGNAGSSELRQMVHQFVIVGTYGTTTASGTNVINPYDQQAHIDSAKGKHNGTDADYEANRTWTSAITDKIPDTIRPYLGF
ncbi:hypothetical protein NVP1031O_171 [Vibrio phage 1.031.O._10N.261.46.F8]|nr:hypothetical protein NVP1031O_171 [Vibrio phage 1.031.O._10N.261.46.F8]